jgi:hypothetical protein
VSITAGQDNLHAPARDERSELGDQPTLTQSSRTHYTDQITAS